MPKRKSSSQPRATHSGRAYLALKRAIILGELAEGVFLTAEEAERSYDISRTPFREACNRLHHERLIEVVPRRGFRVTELRFREVRELLEVRLLLEGIIAELATARATPAQIEQLDKLADQTGTALESGANIEAAVQANNAFHLCLAEMTQNRELLELERGILERTERISHQQLRSLPDRAEEIQMLHKPIVTAIRRRDAKAVRAALERDVRQGQSDLFGSSGGSKE